jgi:putative transposase
MYKTLTCDLKLGKQTKEILDFYCVNSRALYNSGLYLLNTRFEESKGYLSYNKLYHEIKNSIHYRNLSAHIAQQTLKVLDRDFRSFFSLLKAKSRNAYKETVSRPKYKPKNSKFLCIFNNNIFHLKPKDLYNIHLVATKSIKEKYNIKSLKIPFNTSYLEDKDVKEIRILPKEENNYQLFVIYVDKTQKEQIQCNQDNYLSIDLGINNLMTCFETKNNKSFIYNGKPIKSINQYYNKKKANLQSKLEKLNKKKFSKKLKRLSKKRNNKIKDSFHKISKNLIDYCFKNEINNIVVGYNRHWKQGINLGKKTNQKFVYLPFCKLTDYIKYKAEERGIKVHFQEESYTSKASALSLDKIPVYRPENKTGYNFSGKRIKRGLYKDNNLSRVINSDLNGSLNILRKFLTSGVNVTNEGFSSLVGIGLVTNPVKLKLRAVCS